MMRRIGEEKTSAFGHRTVDDKDRVILHLYLPKAAIPPYQTVFYFGGGNMLTARTADEVATRTMDYIVKSGRAVALPAYAGTLERGPSGFNTPISQRRDQSIMRVKDISRTIDYLATRDDIDMSKIGFYGLSFGAGQMTLAIPVEPRVRVAVLASVGVGRAGADLPAADYWNYIPRVRIPVLMLNGRDDVLFPVEQSQKLYFKTLGTAEKDKRYVVYPGGHVDFSERLEAIKETLNWLDRYLGPVQRQ